VIHSSSTGSVLTGPDCASSRTFRASAGVISYKNGGFENASATCSCHRFGHVKHERHTEAARPRASLVPRLQIGTPAYDSEQRESAEAASRPVEPGGQVHLAKPASRGLGPQPP